MSQSLSGKVALITGAARGQGRAHAVRLAAEGADIIAIDIAGPLPPSVPYDSPTPDDLAETARGVTASGSRVITAEVDIRDLDALKQEVAEFPVVQQAGVRYSWDGEQAYGMLERSNPLDKIAHG